MSKNSTQEADSGQVYVEYRSITFVLGKVSVCDHFVFLILPEWVQVSYRPQAIPKFRVIVC